MKITKTQLKQIIKEEVDKVLDEQGSFTHSDDLSGGRPAAATTGQLMGRGDEPANKNIKVPPMWENLATMLMEPPYSEDPKQLEKDLEECRKVDLEGERGAGIMCLYNKNTGRRSAMEEIG